MAPVGTYLRRDGRRHRSERSSWAACSRSRSTARSRPSAGSLTGGVLHPRRRRYDDRTRSTSCSARTPAWRRSSWRPARTAAPAGGRSADGSTRRAGSTVFETTWQAARPGVRPAPRDRLRRRSAPSSAIPAEETVTVSAAATRFTFTTPGQPSTAQVGVFKRTDGRWFATVSGTTTAYVAPTVDAPCLRRHDPPVPAPHDPVRRPDRQLRRHHGHLHRARRPVGVRRPSRPLPRSSRSAWPTAPRPTSSTRRSTPRPSPPCGPRRPRCPAPRT